MKPREIQKREKGLHFIWQDEKEMTIPLSWLRNHCACAVCLNLDQAKAPLFSTPEELNQNYSISRLELVGNYALGVWWKDGHHSILPFDRIRKEFENLTLPPHLSQLVVQGSSVQ